MRLLNYEFRISQKHHWALLHFPENKLRQHIKSLMRKVNTECKFMVHYQLKICNPNLFNLFNQSLKNLCTWVSLKILLTFNIYTRPQILLACIFQKI